jgi:hypothetical protein
LDLSVGGRHLPHVDVVLKALGNIFRRRIWGKVRDNWLYRLFSIWREGKIAEINSIQRGLHG